MATGDITVTIEPGGFSALLTTAGFTSGQTFNFGLTGNNVPGASTPYIDATSLGFTNGVADTKVRRCYLMPSKSTTVMRFPYGTVTVAGSYTSGTFTDGETVIQTTSLATGIVVGAQSSGTKLTLRAISGTPDSTAAHTWVGQSSAAIFAPSATPVTVTVPTNHEIVSSTGCTCRVGLSEMVFQKDNTGGGNSGTAPTVTIPAGFITNSGGAAQTSNALSAAAVTQNSTAAYPIVRGQWDHIAGVCTADMVTGAYSAAFNADHNYGMDCVILSSLGQTSAVAYSQTVTNQIATARSATGYYENAFVAAMSVSGLTNAELVDLRARAYPLVGDSSAVLDTDSNVTINDEPLGKNKPTIVYNSTPKYAYVNSSTGNDGTGVASTTEALAAAAPFLNIGKAVQNDATVIKLADAGPHNAVGSASTSRRATTQWYVVQPASGITPTVQLDTVRSFKCQRMRFDNVTITLPATNCWLDGEAAGNSLRFTNCAFNHGATGSPTTQPGYETYVTYFENCTGDLSGTNWSLGDFSTARIANQFDGCVFTDGNTGSAAVGAWYRITACKSTGPMMWGKKAAANVAPTQGNLLVHNNRVIGFNNTGAAPWILIGDTIAVSDVSIIGNDIEQIIAGGATMALGADNAAVTMNNILCANNTTTGGRWNFNYNDTGTALVTHTNWRVLNNIWESIAIKSDTFTGTPNGNRQGNWAALFGCGFSGNYSPYITSVGTAAFGFEFPGLNCFQTAITAASPPTATTSAKTVTAFTNRTAWDGTSGSAGGDYTLGATSPAIGIPVVLIQPYDKSGVARTATDNAGAYHFAATATGSPQQNHWGPKFLFR